MVRFSFSMVGLSLALMGCQQTKLSSKPPAAPAAAQAAPAAGYPVAPGYPVNPGPGPAPAPGMPPQVPPNYPPPPTIYPDGSPVNPGPGFPSTPVQPTTPSVTPVDPPMNTYPPSYTPANPTNDNFPANPPVTQTPVTPVFQPPSIRDPEVVIPPQPAPLPGPGEQIIQQPPPATPVPQPMPIPAPAPQPVAQPGPQPGLQPMPAPQIPAQEPIAQPVAQPTRPGLQPMPAPATGTPTKNPPTTGQVSSLPRIGPVAPVRPANLGEKPQARAEDQGSPVVSVSGTCGPVALDATDKPHDDKLDVLFVVDTSASLRGGQVRGKEGELAQLASQMGNFVDALPANMDIRIGVMLGHGTTSHTGRLFSAGRGDPAVLKVSDFGRDRARLARILKEKMQKVPNESGGAQGEALMYSLYQSVSKASLRNEIQKQDFYRADAALAVIMVTDEQDVCYDYSKDGNSAYKPVGRDVRNRKGQVISKIDKIEADFLKGTCATAGPNKTRLNHQVVYSALSAMKKNTKDNQKLMLFGLVYTDEKLTPKPGREDENEMGHGIIDLVALQDSSIKRLADLNTVQEGPNKFGPELAFFGNLVKKELASNGVISCQPKDVSAYSIDERTVKAQLLNEKGETIGVFSEECLGKDCGAGRGGMTLQLRKNTRSAGFMQANLDQKTLNALLNAHKSKNNKVKFTFMTRTDRDVKTGATVNPQTGKPVAMAKVSGR